MTCPVTCDVTVTRDESLRGWEYVHVANYWGPSKHGTCHDTTKPYVADHWVVSDRVPDHESAVATWLESLHHAEAVPA